MIHALLKSDCNIRPSAEKALSSNFMLHMKDMYFGPRGPPTSGPPIAVYSKKKIV